MKSYRLGGWAGLLAGLATGPLYLGLFWSDSASGLGLASDRIWKLAAVHPPVWTMLGLILVTVVSRNIVAWSGVVLGAVWFVVFWGFLGPAYLGLPVFWAGTWTRAFFLAVPSLLAGGITGFIAGVFGPTPVH